jgi:hypothetical protein
VIVCHPWHCPPGQVFERQREILTTVGKISTLRARCHRYAVRNDKYKLPIPVQIILSGREIDD